jgi:hypothetical protein
LWPAYGAPLSWAGDPNPAGAITAALLGAIAVTRDFIEQVTQSTEQDLGRRVSVPVEHRVRFALPLGRVELCALDLIDPGRPETEWTGVNLGDTRMASLGAVNGDLLYYMRLSGDVAASIVALEPQALRRTDLNRYLCAVARGVDLPKAQTGEALASERIKVQVRPARVEDDPEPFGETLVISGVDNNAARWEVQRRAPAWLLSLESEHEETRLSMHHPSRGACLGCLHTLPIEPDPEQPTHPAVSGWPALLAFVTLLQPRSEWTPGLQVRINGLDPSDWSREVFEPSEACALPSVIASHRSARPARVG